MDAEAPILAADRVSPRFGGVRPRADVCFDAGSGDILSVIRRRKRDLDITTLLVDRNARMARSAAGFGCAMEQRSVVLDRTATSLAGKGFVKKLDLGGRGAERGSVHTLTFYKRRKRCP